MVHQGTPTKDWFRGKMDKLRAVFGGCCQNCGNPNFRQLEFAHVAPTPILAKTLHKYGRIRGRGQMSRYYDIKRNPLHYILLCHDCHTEYDRGPKNGTH